MKITSLIFAVASVAISIGNASQLPEVKKENELMVPLESWVKKCTIDSAKMTEDNCIHIERGATVGFVNGLYWMPKLNGNNGILVIHPFTPKRPALIEYPVLPADVGKFIHIIARGSDNEPGGELRIKSRSQNGDSDLGKVQIDSEWVETGAQIPSGATQIILEWHAIGWFNEMLWVDCVDVVQKFPN